MVGIVGEIYVKYSPLGNNHLEDFLIREGAEVVMAGVGDFMMYCLSNREIDARLYGRCGIGVLTCKLGYHYLHNAQRRMIKCIKRFSHFKAPTDFEKVKKLASDFMGESTVIRKAHR